jgi:hypothetical protein
MHEGVEPMKAEVRFRVRDKGHVSKVGLGPGTLSLVEAIAQTGSTAPAAKKLRISASGLQMLGGRRELPEHGVGGLAQCGEMRFQRLADGK